MEEYLINLRECHCSGRKVTKNFPRNGDIALFGDDSVKKRNDWKLGVVQKYIKGRDNEFTGAKVRVKGMKKPLLLSRPVQKLFPIEVGNENEQVDQIGELGVPEQDGSLIHPVDLHVGLLHGIPSGGLVCLIPGESGRGCVRKPNLLSLWSKVITPRMLCEKNTCLTAQKVSI